ncbi:peroxiredoxin-like family protein [Humibacter ginsenosidimutans]|uniref:AhpC/TSA family protein n=1 Tax=Humibacter ginsenosidimutans TaxID=2599293 RepID=A0A5B8M110_9MICO|nr:peroxiredoxin-like family protein [Humibacter ginsenosidimutans]QDZ13624.1 AhpC/TSA family protein [Humibacter ginsenosidimutans]
MTRIAVGDVIERRPFTSIHDRTFTVPDDDRIVHLQFRRFAGCPVCNLHLHQVGARLGELTDAGILEVAFFHSRPEVMRDFQGELPFDAVADPERIVYREFGVERITLGMAWRALVPHVWTTAIRSLRWTQRRRGLRGSVGEGENVLGLPAEFLIAPNGTVLTAHYGRSVDDHWSVDEILSHAAAERSRL